VTLLCVEASSRVATVALVGAGRPPIELSCGDPRASSEWLAGAVADVLAQAGVNVHTLAGLEGIALGVGPGGLTGLRMATAFIKGLAFAAPVPLPIIPVNSLAALLAAPPMPAQIAVVDGSKGWVYVAGQAATTLEGATDWFGLPTALAPVAVFGAWAQAQPAALALVTDGSTPARAAAESASALGWPASHGLTPTASAIGALALRQTDRALPVRDFRLGYLRPASDFKTLAEQAHA
jgi:tRNA threonylcarbamoyl adenosine modification protein YeaZ